MDINASLSGKPRVAVTLQPNTDSASSAMTSSQKPPTVQSFDRWHEMPAEITFQIMQWMMLDERSRFAPASFAITSKSFHQVGQAFRRHHLYESAQAILLHPSLVNRSRSYLDSLGYRPRLPDINNPEELISLLTYLSKDDGTTGPMYYLDLVKIPETAIFDSRVDQAIRAYKGKSLSLYSNGNRSANKLASHIARTLPTSAGLNLYLYLDLKNLDGKEVAELINVTCTLGHITSIELLDCKDSASNPVVRQAVMNVLCGNGQVSHAVFNFCETNDLLKDLTAGFQEIRHLQLLSMQAQENTTHSDLQALVAAIEQRHASGQPRITVVLGLWQRQNPQADSTSFLKEKILELESLGLFFGRLDSSHAATTLLNKVRQSVGEGPIGSYINTSRFVAASETEDSESSDVIVELSDEEPSVLSCEDNFSEDANESSRLRPEYPELQTGRRPQNPSNYPEPAKKRRDRCVIS